MLLLFSPSSFFLKREEEDKEEEETLEMIALPLCLLRFVRVRALVAAVALVLGGIDDDDNIFYLSSSLSYVIFCVTFRQEREMLCFEEHSTRARDLNFLFFVSFRFSLSKLVSQHKKCSSLALSKLFSFVVLVLLLFWGREEDFLPPLQHEDDDDDPVNENDDWVCKNNDHCFHPDFNIVVVFVAKKFKDHL